MELMDSECARLALSVLLARAFIPTVIKPP
jgi:hypothetical protein